MLIATLFAIFLLVGVLALAVLATRSRNVPQDPDEIDVRTNPDIPAYPGRDRPAGPGAESEYVAGDGDLSPGPPQGREQS